MNAFRWLALLMSVLLAACGGGDGGGSSSAGSTRVEVRFFGAAAGAVGAQPPANLARIKVVAASGGNVVAGPAVADAASGWVAVLDVPNGKGIVFRARGFDANGAVIYQGASAPKDLIGLPVTVSITLQMVVSVSGPKTANRGQQVLLTGKVAGQAPPASSQLAWGATGGAVVPVAGTNGGQANWTAPLVPGVFDVYAWVVNNPDQPTSVRGVWRIQVVNRNPYAAADVASVLVGGSVLIDVLANDTDADGDRLSIQSVGQPANGQASIVAGKVRYVPKPGFVGQDRFSYVVVDPYGGKAQGSVAVDVVANRVPVFIQPVDHFTSPGAGYTLYGQPGQTLDLYVQAKDPDGGAINFSIYSQPNGGTLTQPLFLGAGTAVLSYTPYANTTNDQFIVQVADNYGAIDLLTVQVAIASLPATPRVIYVDPVAGSDANGGVAGWVDAYATITQALSIAQPGDEIRLAATPPANPGFAESIWIDVANITISGGWDPATNTRGVWDYTVIRSPNPAINAVTVNARNVTLQQIDTTGGWAGIEVLANGGVRLVSHWSYNNNVGLQLDYGGVADLYTAYLGSNAGDGIWANGGSLLLNDVLLDGNGGAGLYADNSTLVQGSRVRAQFNGAGGLQLYGAQVNLQTPIVINNQRFGVLFDLYAQGTIAHGMIAGTSVDPYSQAAGNGCGIMVRNTAPGAVQLANLLVVSNQGCGLGVDAGANATAEFLSVMENGSDPYANAHANVGNLGSLSIRHSILSYADPNIAVDYYGAAGATLTVTAPIIVADGSFAGVNVLNQDPYALRVTWLGPGQPDPYASHLPYLSQPTAGLPVSPAINAGIVLPSATLVAGLTTDLYGAPDADPYGNVDLGFHFPSGDLDDDMLPDAWEGDPYSLAMFGTDPTVADTDGDGYKDGFEALVYGTDPQDPYSYPGAPPGAGGGMIGGAITLTAWSDFPGGVPVGGQVNIFAQLQDSYGAPIQGAVVNFTIQNSPYAVFSQNGLQTIDVYTDPNGIAIATIQDAYAETVSVLVQSFDFPTQPASVTVNQLFATNQGAGIIVSAANGNNQIAGASCNTHWDLTGSPYWVQSPVTVAVGCSLVIDPYTVVKFAPGASIDVYGVLDVYGRAGAPVVFTSARDDAIGGDTNGDGNLTQPAAGDYLAAMRLFSGVQGTISDAEIRYANQGMVVIGASPQVSNLRVHQFLITGIVVDAPTATDTASPSFVGVDLYSASAAAIGVRVGDLAVPPAGNASPVFSNINIVLANAGTSSVAMLTSGGNVQVWLDGGWLTGGGVGVDLYNFASLSMTNTAIVGMQTGLRAVGASFVDLRHSAVASNPQRGIELQSGNLTVEDSLISGNGFAPTTQGAAVLVHPGAYARITNTQITQNAGSEAIRALGDPTTATGAGLDLYGNTIAENFGAGVSYDPYTTGTMRDNIIVLNQVAPEVRLSAGVIDQYNMTSNVALAGVGDIYAATPANIGLGPSWYLNNTSLAIDADGTQLANNVLYVQRNPYAQLNVADVGALDLGMHHGAAAPVPVGANSPITPTAVTAGAGKILSFKVTLTDAFGNPLGMAGIGMRVQASLSPGTNGASIKVIRDWLDGSYEVVVDATGATAGTSDTLLITVDGVLLATQPVLNY